MPKVFTRAPVFSKNTENIDQMDTGGRLYEWESDKTYVGYVGYIMGFVDNGGHLCPDIGKHFQQGITAQFFTPFMEKVRWKLRTEFSDLFLLSTQNDFDLANLKEYYIQNPQYLIIATFISMIVAFDLRIYKKNLSIISL